MVGLDECIGFFFVGTVSSFCSYREVKNGRAVD